MVRRTQIPEKVREKLDLRDDDYVVWFNDYAGRWWIGKGKIQISSMRDLHSRKLSPNERKAYWEWKQRRIKDHSILGL